MRWIDDMSLRWKLMGAFGLVLAIVVGQSAFVYQRALESRAASEQVKHSNEVIATSIDTRNALIRVETNYNNFLMTGDEKYVEAYNKARKDSTVRLQEMQKRTADNPTQMARYKEIEQRATVWQNEVTEPGVKLRRDFSAGQATATDLLKFEGTGDDIRHFDGIRGVFNTAVDAEFALLKKLTSENAAASERLSEVVLWGTFGVIILSLAIAFSLSRAIGRPMSKMAYVANRIAVGDIDQNIDHRSRDEIGTLANAFRDSIDYIKGIAGAADALSKGDLTAQVTPRSEQDVLSKNFIHATDALRGLVYETNLLIKASQDGRLNERGNADKFHGVYADLVRGINQALDAVTEPINEAAGALGKLAARDLTVRMKGEYKGDFAKIKETLNTAANNLDEALSQVAVAARKVALASDQISAGSWSLSRGASDQASSLEEVSSSLQEMSSITRQNTTNSQEARSLSEGARASAEKGVESMKHLSEAMDRIKASSGATAKIVKTIDEIAFQTNLLALNAAVEAARAGDAGKGFAVVADEVRNLAMRSAEAAKNTASLIEESVMSVEDGVASNREVLKNLEEIDRQVKKVREVMTEIVAASEQQSEGVNQINKAVMQMNQLTQQTAANAEESAGATEELSSQAKEMLSMVANFDLTDANGSASTSHGLRVQPAHTVHAGATAEDRAGSGRRVSGPRKRQRRAARVDSDKLVPLNGEDDGENRAGAGRLNEKEMQR